MWNYIGFKYPEPGAVVPEELQDSAEAPPEAPEPGAVVPEELQKSAEAPSEAPESPLLSPSMVASAERPSTPRLRTDKRRWSGAR